VGGCASRCLGGVCRCTLDAVHLHGVGCKGVLVWCTVCVYAVTGYAVCVCVVLINSSHRVVCQNECAVINWPGLTCFVFPLPSLRASLLTAAAAGSTTMSPPCRSYEAFAGAELSWVGPNAWGLPGLVSQA
jgi:hypothetical protein